MSWIAIEALTDPAWQALQTDLTLQERRGKVSSLLGILGASFGFFGSLVGGYLYGLNPALPFWIYLPLTISAPVIAYHFIHEPEKPEK